MAAVGYQRHYQLPDRVQWPPQFVAEDGLLLPGGALDPNEAPFGITACELTGRGGAGVPLEWHQLRDAEYQRACKEWLSFWQELVAPDGRPYYYDHASHTWSFARPSRWRVRASSLAAEQDGGADTQDVSERLQLALAGVLPRRPAPGAGGPEGAAGPRAAPQLPAQQGPPAQLQGQRPPAQQQAVPGSGGPPAAALGPAAAAGLGADRGPVRAMAGHGAAQEIPGARYAPAAAAAPYPGGQYALAPAAAPYLGGQATGHPHLQPDAYRDCLETDIMGQKYWFNPHTQASAWSSQQLIRMNQQFYAGLSYVPAGPGQQHGPKGELGWWVWQGADAGQHMGWTMEALWKKVQPSISGTGEGDRPAEPQEQGLRADLDVEEAGQPHSRYWYNPKTLANAWTREELVALNTDFYAGVKWVQSPGKHGPSGDSWWTWVGPGGRQHAAWTLQELWKAYRPDGGAGGG